jgi:hypothetical protein
MYFLCLMSIVNKHLRDTVSSCVQAQTFFGATKAIQSFFGLNHEMGC